VLRGLAGASYGFGILVPGATAAKKKKKKKPKKPRATCPAGMEIGSVVVPGTGATVDTPVLKQGQRYRLRAVGFWLSSTVAGQDAFANFPLASPNTPVLDAGGVRLGLSVADGSPAAWGSYTTTHIYEREVTGEGAPLSLRCKDPITEDNSGAVLVQVLCA
jgi:hypothetical protein